MIEFSGLTEAGPVREDNQDALVLPDGTRAPAGWTEGATGPERATSREGELFALADGMGGYAHGDIASRMALQAVWNTFFDTHHLKIPGALRKGVEAANLAVLTAARELGVARMGSTLTAGVIAGNTLHIAHIGDARAYLIRGRKAALLTQDHSVVGDLLRMRVVRPEQVRDHARRSVLTRAVGLSLFPQPDVFSLTLQAEDWLVLCTDGVWSVVQDDEFASLACAAQSANSLCRSLLDLALARETDDNVSALAIRVITLQAATPQTGNKNGKVMRRWFF